MDWGQGLRLAKSYLDDHPAPSPIFYDYFGQAPVPVLLKPHEVVPLAHAPASPDLRVLVSTQNLLRKPHLRRSLASLCGVEAGFGPSLYLLCCPPCRDPALDLDIVLRQPLAPPPGTPGR